MNEKRCNYCGMTKSSEDFYVSNKTGLLLTPCKACNTIKKRKHLHSKKGKIAYKVWFEKTREIRKVKAKEYRDKNEEKIKAHRKIYMDKNRDKVLKTVNEYRRKEWIKYPEKMRARNAVTIAVFRGKIIKPTICSQCDNSGRIEGHHTDYSKPLDVVWVCPYCHKKIHRELKKELENA